MTDIGPREVVRCLRCLLVQFRTLSDLCRRCAQPLPAPPRMETADNTEMAGAQKTAGRDASRDADLQSRLGRGKTTRHLTIGRRLRELREQRRLTQQQMASKAGVPRTYISRIENARLLPGPVMLQRIAEALAVPLLDLLPQNPGAESLPGFLAGSFWRSIEAEFSKLRPEDMALVVERAHHMATQRESLAYSQKHLSP